MNCCWPAALADCGASWESERLNPFPARGNVGSPQKWNWRT